MKNQMIYNYQMRTNINQDKEKKPQYFVPLKSSYISTSNKNDTNTNILYRGNTVPYQEKITNLQYIKQNKMNNIEEQNIKIGNNGDEYIPKQFPKRQNYMSSENLLINKNLQSQAKSIRQSQIVVNGNKAKTPRNSACQKKLTNIKSATNFTKASNDSNILYIKSDNSATSGFNFEDTDQTRQLNAKIKQVQSTNQNLLQQITQLQYMKLYLSSQSIQIIRLKTQIIQLDRKIYQIKKETSKIQTNYPKINQYYNVQKRFPQQQIGASNQTCQSYINTQHYNYNSHKYKLSQPQTSHQSTIINPSPNIGCKTPTHIQSPNIYNSHSSSTSNLSALSNPNIERNLMHGVSGSHIAIKKRNELQQKTKYNSNYNEQNYIFGQNQNIRIANQNVKANDTNKYYIIRK